MDRPIPSHTSPLGPADLAVIAHAARDLRPARRAERIAGTSGLLTALAGLASFPFVLGSGVGMALSIALVVIGCREWSLRAELRSLEPLASGRLARNQIALGVALIGYAVVQLTRAPVLPDSLAAGGQLDQTPEMAGVIEGIARMAHYGLYAGLIVGAFLVQGSQAIYYARVGRTMRRAYARHPIWIMRTHAAAWSGRPPGAEPPAPAAPPVPDGSVQIASEPPAAAA